MSESLSFSRPNNIPLLVHTVFGLSIHLSVDTWVLSNRFFPNKVRIPSLRRSFVPGAQAPCTPAGAPQNWVLCPPLTSSYTLPNDSIYGLKYPLAPMTSGISVQMKLLSEPQTFHPPPYLTALFMHISSFMPISSCVPNWIS